MICFPLLIGYLQIVLAPGNKNARHRHVEVGTYNKTYEQG